MTLQSEIISILHYTDDTPGEIRIVKPDQESWSWDYKIRDVVIESGKGLPAINRTGPVENPKRWTRGKFTAAVQFFWADLLAMRVYNKLLADLPREQADEIKKLFKDLGQGDRFLTNGAGTDTHNDYVNAPDPSKLDPDNDGVIDPLICAGSRVRILEVVTSQGGTTTGLEMARIDAFSDTGPFPTVTMDLLENDPRVLRARDIQPSGNLTDFAQIENRFPWLDSYWVPYPLAARQECFFPLQDLEKVQ